MSGVMFPKRSAIRSKKLTDAARGEACTICGAQDGTVVFCHLNESFAGKCMRQKGDDIAGFFGCAKCHAAYDIGLSGGYAPISDWEILRGMYLTTRRWIEKGALVIR